MDDYYVAKIIKKTKQIIKPAMIGGQSAQIQKQKKSGHGWESLALSGFIASEIDELKIKIAEDARIAAEAHARELERAYQDGYEKGVEDGIQRERDDRMKSIDALLQEAKNKSMNAIRNLEIKIFDLAVTIAEKMIRKSISADPEIVDDMVSEIMTNIIGSETVVLKVSAEDYQVINGKYNTWLSLAGGSKEFKIEIDKRLRTGDFIVETDGGIIDGVISDRIDVLVEELMKVSG